MLPPIDSIAGAEYLPLSLRQFLQQCLDFLGAARCVTPLTISGESPLPYYFFYPSHKIIRSEDVSGGLYHVHFLPSKTIIHGYTKEDTYGGRNHPARLI